MLFSGKRGMSPLIATVLLIAFAVAIGAMIMNWSSGVTSEEGAATVDCTGVAVHLEQAMCATDNQITLSAKNTGDVRIDALEIILVNEAEDLDLRLKVKDSSLIPTEKILKTVMAIVPNLDTVVEINPMIYNADSELVSCSSKGLVQDKLVTC